MQLRTLKQVKPGLTKPPAVIFKIKKLQKLKDLRILMKIENFNFLIFFRKFFYPSLIIGRLRYLWGMGGPGSGPGCGPDGLGQYETP